MANTSTARSTKRTATRNSSKPAISLPRGFTKELMTYARSNFKRGRMPSQVSVLIRENFYGPYPTTSAVSHAYIAWKKSNVAK